MSAQVEVRLQIQYRFNSLSRKSPVERCVNLVMAELLLTGAGRQRVKASSTLNRSIEFSAKNMFDGDPNTCWNSDQGDSQSLLIDFQRGVRVRRLVITFQGGFVGQV